ncbi:WS/DGAT/MGAT family acyltransferase [Pseudomonas fluvialis]|uniref:diacylglycerol O-acyltransferase n=1 Tax=Pseudomonas fluvialis TaxID=1793966 RepID=A0A7X0ER17_9PSED|nr:wax ester/triacylglycerol synthase family O-acyltransferase [Pseudomonas fluvialis]MBB6340668.1 WS/DGAT/MGAT family acyltransferase [Pseudomonas fluvialis]
MKQLSPMDSHFFYFETPNQPMVIGSLWLCDQNAAPNGIVRHKEILQYIGDRLNTTPMFRRRLAQAPLRLDDPYWLEDESFDLEYHVRHVGLPQPGDWRQLCIFTARTMSRTLDMDRAPWEIYIIEGLNNVKGIPQNSFAVLIRFHHAYADGKSALELSTALMEDTPQHEFGKRSNVEYVERTPTPLEMWARTTPRLFNQSLRSLKAGVNVARKGAQLLAHMRGDSRPEQRRVPQSIFNAAVTPHRAYGGHVWPLKDLKRIRQLHRDVSLNDIIISIIAGGLRRYLISHGKLPADGSLVSLCPVSLRAEEARKDGGNLISAMYIAIGTDIEDPVTRLEAVHRRTLRGIPLAKEVLYGLSNSAGELFPPYLRSLATWVQTKTRFYSKIPLINTIITNVPGIPGMVPRYFAGAPILSVFPVVPVADGMAISHGITGIYDNLNLGVLADRSVMPDMDHYIACIEASTEQYLALATQHEARLAEQRAAAASADQAEAGPAAVALRRSRKGASEQAAAERG